MKISVAMATYNGEKYIKEQLQSILQQTMPVDEIIISDDGSSDATLVYIDEFISAMKIGGGTSVRLLRDNPRHGYCGNFEWALKHTTGDYIFLSDQDDIWHPEKVEKIMTYFQKNSEAMMVFHDSWLVKKQGELLQGSGINIVSEEYILKLSKDKFLENAVSSPFVAGMAMCITRKLMSEAIPFPKSFGLHDQWVLFLAILKDSCYYLNEKLTYYRIHGENTAGNRVYKGNLFDRIKKIRKRINKSWKEQNEFIILGNAMKNKMIEYDATETEAYKTALRICEIGEKLQDVFESNRIIGTIKLCKLFITDMRYRRSGVQAFLYQLASILLM